MKTKMVMVMRRRTVWIMVLMGGVGAPTLADERGTPGLGVTKSKKKGPRNGLGAYSALVPGARMARPCP